MNYDQELARLTNHDWSAIVASKPNSFGGFGWTEIRFSDDDVKSDAEAAARAIANELGIPYELKKRQKTGSGMRSVRAAKRQRQGQQQPSPRCRSTLPEGG